MAGETRQVIQRHPGTVSVRSWTGRAGAALITALGMLLLFVALGTAYVRYMSLERVETRAALQNLRTHHLARGGLYAAIGEIEAAVKAGVSPSLSYSFDVSVYLPGRDDLNGHPQTIEVALVDESGGDTLEGAFREVGTKMNVIRTIIKNTAVNTDALRKWKASRCYRIESRAEVHLSGRRMLSAVAAIVTLDEMGDCEIRFWTETHRAAEIEDSSDASPEATDEAGAAPGEGSAETVETEIPEPVQTAEPVAG